MGGECGRLHGGYLRIEAIERRWTCFASNKDSVDEENEHCAAQVTRAMELLTLGEEG